MCRPRLHPSPGLSFSTPPLPPPFAKHSAQTLVGEDGLLGTSAWLCDSSRRQSWLGSAVLLSSDKVGRQRGRGQGFQALRPAGRRGQLGRQCGRGRRLLRGDVRGHPRVGGIEVEVHGVLRGVQVQSCRGEGGVRRVCVCETGLHS